MCCEKPSRTCARSVLFVVWGRQSKQNCEKTLPSDAFHHNSPVNTFPTAKRSSTCNHSNIPASLAGLRFSALTPSCSQTDQMVAAAIIRNLFLAALLLFIFPPNSPFTASFAPGQAQKAIASDKGAQSSAGTSAPRRIAHGSSGSRCGLSWTDAKPVLSGRLQSLDFRMSIRHEMLCGLANRHLLDASANYAIGSRHVIRGRINRPPFHCNARR